MTESSQQSIDYIDVTECKKLPKYNSNLQKIITENEFERQYVDTDMSNRSHPLVTNIYEGLVAQLESLYLRPTITFMP